MTCFGSSLFGICLGFNINGNLLFAIIITLLAIIYFWLIGGWLKFIPGLNKLNGIVGGIVAIIWIFYLLESFINNILIQYPWLKYIIIGVIFVCIAIFFTEQKVQDKIKNGIF